MDWAETPTLFGNYRVKFKLTTGAQCNVLTTSVASKCECQVLQSKTKYLVSLSKDSVPGFVYDIDLVGQPNLRMYPPRKVPYSIRNAVKQKLNTMRDNIIERITEPTPAVSPMGVVHKNLKVRICTDPLDINKNFKRQHFPLQTIEEIATCLHRSKYVTFLDSTKGFWQVKVPQQTSFATLWGRYACLRMPFGLASTTEHNLLCKDLQKYWTYREQLAYNYVIFKRTQTLIPAAMKSLVLSQLHHAHKGIQGTVGLAKEHVFWDGMRQDVTEYMRKCTTCQKLQRDLPQEPLSKEDPPPVLG
ncbi:hypothetical protein PR048_032870 [Dryococelus australis]|uniref:RNA-directed DNA polymerase n=1 Tax=Dryococelus australis TaxID=614101 RepID=A0ABQ9G3F7_9NEOP|nr:hypothetical protein PR048_032870 [Dryococelus australis]